MRALAWAFELKGVYPEVKLLAIYVASASGFERHVTIDIDDAAEFCGVRLSPETIEMMAGQIPDVTFEHERGSRRIRFDMKHLVEAKID